MKTPTRFHTAFEMLTGPKDYIEFPGITHFEMYMAKPSSAASLPPPRGS